MKCKLMKGKNRIRLYLVIFVLVLGLTTNLSAQSLQDTIQAHRYFTKADSLLTARTTDSSLVYFHKALPIYQKAKDWEKIVACHHKIAHNHINKGEFDQAFSFAKKSVELAEKHLSKNHRQLAFAYEALGYYYQRGQHNFKQALDFYNLALTIRKKSKQILLEDIGDIYYYIGFCYKQKTNDQKALNYLFKAFKIYIKLKIENKQARTAQKIGNALTHKKAFNEASKYLVASLNTNIYLFGQYNENTAISYYYIAILFSKKLNYKKSLLYMKKYLKITKHLHGEVYYNVALGYETLGDQLSYMKDYKNALKYYQSALKTYIKLGFQDHFKTQSVFRDIGVLHKNLGNYELALSYYKKSQIISENFFEKNYSFLRGTYNNIGVVYKYQNKYIKSEKYYLKALKNLKLNEQPFNQAIWLNNLSYVYNKLAKFDNALKTGQKSLNIRLKHLPKNHPNIAESYNYMGHIYLKQENTKQAMEYYTKALSILQKAFGDYDPEIAITCNNIAAAYLQQQNLSTALQWYQKAIKSNILTNSRNNDDESGSILGPNHLNVSLAGVSKVNLSLFQKTQDLQYLYNNHRHHQKADSLIQKLRDNIITYQDKLVFAEKAKEIYNQAVQNEILLYQQNKDSKHIQAAFYYTEQSKANTLKDLINEYQANDFAGLPASVLEFESSLRSDVAYYQSKLAKAQNKNNQEEISEYQNLLFDTERRQDSLKEKLETQYPNYYQLRHQNQLISIPQVQERLNPKTTLVNYVVRDSLTYAITISKNSSKVYTLQTEDLQQNIAQFKDYILQKDISNYNPIAYQLYQQLIAPIQKDIVDHELIIIPDGALWYLNFDLLLSQHTQSHNPKELPYLLHDYAISYANSASVLFNSFAKTTNPTHQTKKECLAFSFSDTTNTTLANTIRLATLRDTGDDLPGTRKEIKAISKIMDGDYFYGKEAIEQNFKQKAHNYNILHLALHGEVDHQNPQNSKLFFTKSKDSTEDNLLYSHELFALNLPAELTVLSACHTGAGKIAKGEGIMSLGNAFQYAGTKSLLLSGWEVSDQTTPQLMESFYRNLKKGFSKSKALQLAKLNYLQNAAPNRSHPAYWGGFYLVGDMKPMFYTNDYNYWTIGFGVLTALLLSTCLLWYFRKKKSS